LWAQQSPKKRANPLRLAPPPGDEQIESKKKEEAHIFDIRAQKNKTEI
jgi:hypothetical protein